MDAARGFEVDVACSSFGYRTLFTVTVSTYYFADFDYPLKIRVEVEPPEGFASTAEDTLRNAGRSVEFAWPRDFASLVEPTSGRYLITVSATVLGRRNWVTIAAGAFTIN